MSTRSLSVFILTFSLFPEALYAPGLSLNMKNDAASDTAASITANIMKERLQPRLSMREFAIGEKTAPPTPVPTIAIPAAVFAFSGYHWVMIIETGRVDASDIVKPQTA